ncbi:hypothetical protein DYB35_010985 [Aphanomyces astaci]|uniref:DDE Tnp4 domain-containing protein n=1 Tax=Aphanomyces astaci TaxID=112090 RepID=A0A3R7E9V2_APHAT|nr:hypothetical protein DYB35_010985 [Aphanomyces astaci]
MFRDRQDIHAAALVKDESESVINDNGELFQDFPASWAVLVDKCYIGLTASTRAIHPKKRPSNGSLDRHDLERNANVSSDRGIVENFFGRVCLLWKISYATFVWGTKCYDAIQRLTFALTNFHLTLMPLRQDDQHQYRAILARYRRMVEENNAKRAAIQRRYAVRRAERMATESLLGETFGDDGIYSETLAFMTV